MKQNKLQLIYYLLREGFFILFIFIFCIQVFASNQNSSLNLPQEIGQMIMIGFNGNSIHEGDPIFKDIMAERIGGVVLFDYNYLNKKFDNNIKDPQQLAKLTQQIQNYNKQSATINHTDFLPLLIGIDYEGGERGTRLQPRHGFPETYNAQYLGSHPIEVTKKQAAIMTAILKNSGINLTFGPDVDLNTNPNNPVIGRLGRSFSSNPNEVVKYAKAFTNTYHAQQILCAYKHFPGHGSSTEDSHLGFVDITKTWNPIELAPYINLLNSENSCNFVMVGHIINHNLDENDYPATLSYKIIHDLLRKQLKFSGIVITDDLQMGAIIKTYGLKTTVRDTILAGADILLFANQLDYDPEIAKKTINIVMEMIADGTITRTRIDESYNRIMAIKQNIH